MRKAISGFTMIEVLVVVAVIGILSTIGVVAFTKVQTDSRDNQRSSRATVISEALEKYYQQNGEYPSCADMQQSASVIKSDVLKGIDTTVLKTPTNNSTDNSITTCQNLTSGPGADIFAYVGDGCSGGDSCLSYSLKYREEATGDIISVDSRHTTDIATSGAPVLSVSSTTFDKVNLSWTAVPNSNSYTVQLMTSLTCEFVGNTTSDISTTAFTNAGRSSGTDYYYRVAAAGVGGALGPWSNCVKATTQALSGINLSATATSNSQVTLNWTSDPSATSGYDLQYSTNSSFSSYTAITPPLVPPGTLTKSVSGLSTGVQYWFRGRSVAGAVYGPWSTDTATTFVPAPASITATTNSSTQITASWASVSVANTYTLERSTTSNFTPATSNSISGITSTSQAVTGLNQGTLYYFRVFAFVGATGSNSSPSANATTTTSDPTGASFSTGRALHNSASSDWLPGQNMSWGPGNAWSIYGSASMNCGAGTTKKYYMQASYNSPVKWYVSGWTTTSQWWIVGTNSPWTTLFQAYVRCDGPNGISNQVYLGQQCRTSGGSAC